ncbi:hypothetical protein HU200_005000 [Digitaria exilis]|uniref:RNase H type-1 domain-containing protein n=1 Tax=Digitaria exilis TaxID=1010633 RepID=A0A835FTT3_9POAL|nr:hypothetical protein HU200_005000 [Digitaria exilis]
MKVNIDAAFDAGSSTGSAGVVICDHHGLITAAATRWFESVPDVLTTEALVAKRSLSWRLNVTFELGRSFDCFKVVWVIRDANSVAHSCASMGAHSCASMRSVSERTQFWLDYILEWLLGLATADCNPASN